MKVSRIQMIWLLRAFVVALLASFATPASAATVRCESIGGYSAVCDLPGAYGVVLERQLGGAPCEFGRNWFWDGRRVWVEENCRGEFRNTLEGFQLGISMHCDGRHQQKTHCPADTNAGVMIESEEPDCQFDSTWGFDQNSVWVDERCETSFRVAVGPAQGRAIRCDWVEDGPRRFCALDTRGGVTLEQSVGVSACVFGSSWGLADGGVWVDGGCSALFRADSVATNGTLGAPPVELACGAPGGGEDFCPALGTLDVTLVSDTSDGRCVEGAGWRATAHGVFVSNGCVGLFEITH